MEKKEAFEQLNLIRNLGHDLQNDLNFILHYLKKFEFSGDESNKRQRCIEIGKSASLKLKKFSVLAKIKQQDQNLELLDLNLLETVEMVVHDLLSSLPGPHPNISLDIDEDHNIKSHKPLLYDALEQLVSNGLLFCEEDSNFEIKFMNDTLIFQNIGEEINENFIPHLYKLEPKTVTRNLKGNSGAGLGLPIVFEVCKRLGYDVAYSFHAGKNTFTIKLK